MAVATTDTGTAARPPRGGPVRAPKLLPVKWVGGAGGRGWVGRRGSPPLQATIIPVYLLIIRMHLYDSLLAIILPSIAFAIPLSVLVLTNFIRDVPKELFESMRVDGASEWGMLRGLALPLTRPALVTVS